MAADGQMPAARCSFLGLLEQRVHSVAPSGDSLGSQNGREVESPLRWLVQARRRRGIPANGEPGWCRMLTNPGAAAALTRSHGTPPAFNAHRRSRAGVQRAIAATPARFFPGPRPVRITAWPGGPPRRGGGAIRSGQKQTSPECSDHQTIGGWPMASAVGDTNRSLIRVPHRRAHHV